MKLWFVVVCAVIVGACAKQAAPQAPVSNGTEAAPASSDPLAYLPADAEIVVGGDLDHWRASELGRVLEAKLLGRMQARVDAFKAACKIDPLTEIHSFSIAIKNATGDKGTVVGVVRGDQIDRVLGCSDQLETHHGMTVTKRDRMVIARDQDSVVGIAVVDPNTIVFAIDPSLDEARLQELVRAGVPLRGSPTFVEMFSKLNPKDLGWFVANGRASAFDELSALGARPTALWGSARIGADLAAEMRMRFPSADQATQVVSSMQGQLGMAKGMIQAQKLELTADNTDAVFKLEMTAAQIDNVANMVGGMLGG
ncbi:MAG: hypothetical protein AB7P03_09220 [Kofleriaceae bacterium]